MSEDKALRKPEKKGDFPDKTVDFFRRLPGKFVQPFKNMWRELKNVTWPSRKAAELYADRDGLHGLHGHRHRVTGYGCSKLIALMVG